MKEGINRNAGFLAVVYYYFYLNPRPPIDFQEEHRASAQNKVHQLTSAVSSPLLKSSDLVSTYL